MNYDARRARLDTTSSKRKKQLDKIYIRDLGICQICGEPCKREDASRDHIKDLMLCTRQEARDINNMQLAHKDCNNHKHCQPKKSKTAIEFRRRVHFNVGESFPKLQDLLDQLTEDGEEVTHESD